ncbi:MAG: hypothetical protein JWM78_736 [Verrucomicrobiaceae bacterium]|nr:hypothetical protein [Verrucomicrobiaceae bacterium]
MRRPSSRAAAFMPSLDTPTSSALPHAGVFRRLAALVYDTFLLFGLLVAPLILILILRGQSQLQNDSVTHDLPPIAPAPVMMIYTVVIVCSFYWYFWRKNGQTLGMQAWRLRLDSSTGNRPTWPQCLIRSGVSVVSLACGGLGYFWLLLNRDHLTWHDRASHTRVVVLPKRSR